MLRIVVNPSDGEDRYRRGLDMCFPGQWDSARYEWYLKRQFAGKKPDILAIRDGHETIAGIGMNYRSVDLPGGDIGEIAIFTAAWTLPDHRGRSCLARLIEAAVPIARSKGCMAVLSFVTRENASCRILQRCGATGVPSFYLKATREKQMAGSGRAFRTKFSGDDDRPCESVDPSIRLHYPTADAWRDQMIRRPGSIESMEMDGRSVVCELADSTERLQYVSGDTNYLDILIAMVRRAHKGGRDFFHFTMSERLASSAAQAGVDVQPGYLMVLDVDSNHSGNEGTRNELSTASWHLHAGDRM